MSTIQYHSEKHVATLTIQSPPANALSSTILMDLSENLDRIEKDHSIKAVIIKGEGRFFSAGADIKEFTSFQDSSDSEGLAGKGQQLFNRIENFHIPIIAAIHGAALGGGLELAMSCHIRYVDEEAKLGLPELNLGIIPGFAGTQRLPRHVGTAKAYEMILTGTPISGKEAEAAGLANKSFSQDELFSEVDRLAAQIASKSAPTIQHVMNLVPYAHTSQFGEGIQAESEAFGKVFKTEDAKEGIQAFIEKRKPQFKDQ
ncbi:enoyl-CoA hydratase [Halobacillus salinarum]|uniref:enoyl-CoA hydratase n=1 Tax=Halobacillus salinarum TaxID=2932257 RepID=UPI0037BF5E46